MKKLIMPLLTLLLVAPLSAQSKIQPHGFHFGAQLSLIEPIDSFKDVARTGYAAGLYFEKEWWNDWAIRLKGEYAVFSNQTYEYNTSTNPLTNVNIYQKLTAEQISGTFEAVYYGIHEKFYGFTGIGYYTRSVDSEISLRTNPGLFPDIANSYTFFTEPNDEFALHLGVGWKFAKVFRTELKYTSADLKWIQASINFRF